MMKFVTKFALATLFLALSSAAFAQNALPTKGDVEVAMKRTFAYDPELTWVIYDIHASVIPGVADVLISIGRSGGVPQATQHIYYSSKTQTAIVGEMMPFGSDPFAQTRAKLQAADGPVLVTGASPVISIVEFSDLQCPHCKTAQPVLEKLSNDFPQVRIVFQQFPLPATMHPWAFEAAKWTNCVGRLYPTMFWKYTDAIFEHQGEIAAATVDDKLVDITKAVGLDANDVLDALAVQKIHTCANLPQTEAIVKKSVDLGNSLDVTQTPTLFVNGRRVVGVADIPYEQLKKMVQFEINHANN
jgi:protein-disulfide isomerase